MIETNRIQVLAKLNREMSDVVARLQYAVEAGNTLEIEKIKSYILELQKKFSQYVMENKK